MGPPSREIKVSASVKKGRLWDRREVLCCSAVQVVAAGAGEQVGAGASRKLFYNSTPKSRLLEEAARERAPSSAPCCHFGAAVRKRSRGLLGSGESCAVAPHVGEAVNEEI